MNCSKCSNPMVDATFFASSTKRRMVCTKCSNIEFVEPTPVVPMSAPATPAAAAVPSAAPVADLGPGSGSGTAAPAEPPKPIQIFRSASSSREYATIEHNNPMPVSASALFRMYKDRLDLGTSTVVIIDGVSASIDTVVNAGSMVVFKERTKERGR